MKTLFSIFFVIVLFTNSYSQIEYLAGKQYKKMNGLWYAIGDENEYSMVDTNHIIIRFKDKINISNFNFENIGVKNLKVISGKYSDGFYEVELPPNEDKFGILTKLEKSGYFEDVFFNIYYKIDSSPDDDLFSGQWNMTKINMLDAWDITTGSSSIIVAVIDVGFDYNNIDLTGHIWTGLGYDFLDNDADPYPYDGSKHGTAVAGIIGASTSNGEGVAGIAGGWNGSGGIKLMLLRAGNDQNGMSNTAVSQAIDYAVQNNANVISMSFSSSSQMPDVESSINNAVNNNVVCIASSGNSYWNTLNGVHYPAKYNNVIAVGATIQNDSRKKYSTMEIGVADMEQN